MGGSTPKGYHRAPNYQIKWARTLAPLFPGPNAPSGVVLCRHLIIRLFTEGLLINSNGPAPIPAATFHTSREDFLSFVLWILYYFVSFCMCRLCIWLPLGKARKSKIITLKNIGFHVMLLNRWLVFFSFLVRHFTRYCITFYIIHVEVTH